MYKTPKELDEIERFERNIHKAYSGALQDRFATEVHEALMSKHEQEFMQGRSENLQHYRL